MANETSTIHFEDETLELYAMGRLPEPEAGPLEEHLLVCSTCQERLTAVDEFIIAFRAAAKQVEKQAKSRTSSWWTPARMWTPVFAAAAAVAVIFFMPVGQLPSETVELRAVRSIDAPASVQSGRTLNLRLRAEGLDNALSYEAEVADSRGKTIWRGAASWSEGVLSAHVSQKLTSGAYWVRVYQADKTSPAREYALTVR